MMGRTEMKMETTKNSLKWYAYASHVVCAPLAADIVYGYDRESILDKIRGIRIVPDPVNVTGTEVMLEDVPDFSKYPTLPNVEITQMFLTPIFM